MDTAVKGLGNFPAFVAKKGGGETDIDSQIRVAIQDAISYVDEELSPERATATEYYQGAPFGNEESGRSQVVLTEVRDGIIGVVPSVLRVIHGPEHTVEFVPRRADQVALSQQETDYVRFVYEEDNNGFLITHSVLKDGLLKKIGVVKWGMDESREVKTMKYQGLTREELALLASGDGVSIGNAKINEGGTVNCEITVTTPIGRIWVIPVPPDDFFWSRDARSLQDAPVVGHRMRLTRSQLLTMGVSESDLDEYGQPIGMGEVTDEEAARRPTSVGDSTLPVGKENQRILYCEAYMMLDVDGDGIATLRRICTLGNSFQPIKNDPVDGLPFAAWSPDPEPHAILGGSWYDRLKDVQLINSQLMRSALDSFSASAFPRIGYVDGQVSVADILNNAIGGPIRMRQPGMIQPIEVPFTGKEAMPILGFMQEVIERRTGQRDGAGSLDMDALQSTGKEAVNAAITAAQAQPELLARLFAEQILKPMFRGLLKLACHPLSKERIVRLRGAYVPINPATFDPNMDVAVNVALGSMNTEKKVAILRDVVADQSAILGQYGPENPVVSIAMLRNAKARILDLQGIKDVDAYYKPVDENWQPPPPPPPQPSPDELWVQAEKEMQFQKDMKDLAIKQDELRLKEEQMRADLALRDRELSLREREAEMKLMEGPHNAEIERYSTDVDAAQKEADRVAKIELERARLDLEREKLEQDAELRKYEADQQAKVASINAKAASDAKEKDDAKQKKDAVQAQEEKQPVVVNIQAPPAPNVTVEPPVVNVAAPSKPKGKRRAKITGPEGETYQIESGDD